MPDESTILLAIDTCGPTGSVALGRLSHQARCSGQSVEILSQIELEGRNYSSTLVAAIGELLAQSGIALRDVSAIVAVSGPGSFTGVRVGLAAVKGLAEPLRIPVVAVSRLEVLAAKSGAPTAALDAHRHEVFLRLGLPGDQGSRVPQVPILGPGKPYLTTGHSHRELLAGAHELVSIHQAHLAHPASLQVALCDDAAAELLRSAWPTAELIRTTPPTAADALSLCAPRVAAGEFVDLALLDGHYLRRSDAEIFGEPAAAQRP